MRVVNGRHCRAAAEAQHQPDFLRLQKFPLLAQLMLEVLKAKRAASQTNPVVFVRH